MGGIGWRGQIQGGGGDTLMITKGTDKCPSDPIFYLFECYFSTFLNACLLSLEVLMIRNEFSPLVFLNHCLRRLINISLHFLPWSITSL